MKFNSLALKPSSRFLTNIDQEKKENKFFQKDF